MRINPAKMAEIYWNRLGRRAIQEVDALLRQYQQASEARSYWIVVKAFLENCGISKEKKH